MDGCSLCLEDYSSKLSTISWAPTLESQPSHKKPDWFGTQFLIKSASPICVQSSCQRVVVIVHPTEEASIVMESLITAMTITTVTAANNRRSDGLSPLLDSVWHCVPKVVDQLSPLVVC
ncbi:unnamed protein product [Sphagnum troendelagicum]